MARADHEFLRDRHRDRQRQGRARRAGRRQFRRHQPVLRDRIGQHHRHHANGTIGGLVGLNGVTDSRNLMTGTIANSYATGPVTATGDVVAGGLVGSNSSSDHDRPTRAGAVNGDVVTGGLVGANDVDRPPTPSTSGTITIHRDRRRHATARPVPDAGGLVGDNDGQITNSYATGAVHVNGGDGTAGGLAGFNSGTIANSYATGSVTHNGDVLMRRTGRRQRRKHQQLVRDRHRQRSTPRPGRRGRVRRLQCRRGLQSYATRQRHRRRRQRSPAASSESISAIINLAYALGNVVSRVERHSGRFRRHQRRLSSTRSSRPAR